MLAEERFALILNLLAEKRTASVVEPASMETKSPARTRSAAA